MIEKIKEYAKELETVSYKEISSFEDGYLGKKVFEVELANGKKKTVERLTKDNDNGDAVVIFPFTKDGKVIIEVQSRPNMIETKGIAIEFPAGMVDKDEEYEKAARRELTEETGYIAEGMEELEWHYQDQGCSNAIIKTFVATGCEKKVKQELDDDEMLEPLEVTMDELIELYNSYYINDASSKLAILTYLNQNKKV